MFDGRTLGKGEEWNFIPKREFIPDRPPIFDSQISKMLGQGEEWDYILGRDFIPGRPPMFAREE